MVIDNGPSHTSGETMEFFESLKPRIHVLFTPTKASWLNQAEALVKAFSTRSLIRGSWCSRKRMVEHILGSKQEYNQRYAHPFDRLAISYYLKLNQAFEHLLHKIVHREDPFIINTR